MHMMAKQLYVKAFYEHTCNLKYEINSSNLN